MRKLLALLPFTLGVMLGAFPTFTVSYFDTNNLATTAAPGTFCYQNIDYINAAKLFITYPFASPVNAATGQPAGDTGVLAIWDPVAAGCVVNNGVTTGCVFSSGWSTVDLTAALTPACATGYPTTPYQNNLSTYNPCAFDFGGGFCDPQQNYCYLVPGARDLGTYSQKTNAGAVVVQINLRQTTYPTLKQALTSDFTLNTPGHTYSIFDISTIGSSFWGGYGAIATADGCLYTTPAGDIRTGIITGSIFQYCPTNAGVGGNTPFANSANWKWVNMSTATIPPNTGPDPTLAGMQSAFWANGYLYYIPFFNGTLGPSASVVNVTVNGDNTMTVQWESGVAFSASWVNFNVQLSWGAYGPITAANIQNGGTTNSTYTIASANYLPGTKLGTQGTLLASNNGGSNNGMSFSIKSGASKIVRFGPTATNSFNDTTAWRMFDLSTLFPTASAAVRNQLCCWTGAVVPGAPAMLIPWGVQINPVSGATYAYSNAVTLLFDSTLPFNNPAAWQYIDLSSITPPASSNYAGGYQYGIADRDGFAYFAPTHTYTNPIYTPTIPPWIQWDPRAPFANTSSWNLTRNTGYFNPATSTYVGEWSTGAGYSAYFNILVFAVYGTAPCRPPYATVGSCGSYSQELSAMELLVINDTGPGVHNSVPTKILGKMPTFPATLPAAIH